MKARDRILLCLVGLLLLGAKPQQAPTELAGEWGVSMSMASDERVIPATTIRFTKDGQFSSDYFRNYGFVDWKCDVTPGRRSYFTASAENNKHESVLWDGSASGDEIIGKVSWKHGDSTEVFEFSGSRSAGKAPTTNWFIVLLYFVAGGACLGAMYKERQAQRQTYEARVPRAWMALGIVLLLLGFAKAVHLQDWVDEIGRSWLKEEHAYGGRRPIQAMLIVIEIILGLAALAAATWYGWRKRNIWRRYLLAAAAITYLLTFVLVRAVSLHQVDHWLQDHSVCGMTYNTILEGLGQLALIAAAGQAMWRDWRPQMRAFERKVRIR